MLSSLIHEPHHPLIRETKRECLEDQWDIDGVLRILGDIRAGLITVREVCVDVPSPMSLPFQWQAEAAEMYEYSPVTQGIREAVYEELKTADMIKPQAEELARLQERKKLPEDEEQLHSLLMMEGDLIAGELPVPIWNLAYGLRRSNGKSTNRRFWMGTRRQPCTLCAGCFITAEARMRRQ